MTPAVNVAPCHDRDLEPFGVIFCATKRFGFVFRKMHHAMVPEEIAPPAITGLVFLSDGSSLSRVAEADGWREAKTNRWAGSPTRWMCGRPRPMGVRQANTDGGERVKRK